MSRLTISLDEKPCVKEIKDMYDWDIFQKIADKKTRIEIMLIMLQELAGLTYRAECAAYGYCVEGFAEAFNAYAEKCKELREEIISAFFGYKHEVEVK